VPLVLTRPNILPSGALLQLCAVSVPRQGPSVAQTQLCVFCLPRMQTSSDSRGLPGDVSREVVPHSGVQSDSPSTPAATGPGARVGSTSSGASTASTSSQENAYKWRKRARQIAINRESREASTMVPKVGSNSSPARSSPVVPSLLLDGQVQPGARRVEVDEEVAEILSDPSQMSKVVRSPSSTSPSKRNTTVAELSDDFSQMKSPSKDGTRQFRPIPPDSGGTKDIPPAPMFNESKAAGMKSSQIFMFPSAVQPRVVPSTSLLVHQSGLDRTAGILCEGELRLGNAITTYKAINELKKEQRTRDGFWLGSWAFPHQDMHRYNSLDATSCDVAPKFCCHGLRGCTVGDCCSNLRGTDVMVVRTNLKRQLAHSLTGKTTNDTAMKEHLERTLLPFYNPELGVWAPVPLNVGLAGQTRVCAASYCLIHGASGHTALTAMKNIISGKVLQAIPTCARTARDALEEVKLAEAMISQYIWSLLLKHECNPVPGAARSKETSLPKKTWTHKWQAYEQYFRSTNPAAPVPGSRKLFIRLWKANKALIERQTLTHAKCSICSKIDKALDELLGNNTDDAVDHRRKLYKLLMEHEREHLADRSVLDEAGFLAYTNPRRIWTIILDAATQRNFELPKFSFRVPKKFGTFVPWKFTLMGAYAYGFGFIPYLIHDSVKHGANVTCTVLWDLLCRMYDVHGTWPELLHLQLDNCSGDNKNLTVFAFAAWLVASGRVKQVRLFFLQVGHTHVIIDQIFGVITKGLKRHEIALPQVLLDNIDDTLENNPQYQPHKSVWLRTLFDFAAWATDELKVPRNGNLGHFTSLTKAQDDEGDYSGLYDFLFTQSGKYMVHMQYRERIFHPYWPSNDDGVQVIGKLPSKPPELAPMLSPKKYLESSGSDFYGTITVAKQYLRSLRSNAERLKFGEDWKDIINTIKIDASLMLPQYRVQFRHFELVVPLLRGPADGGGNWVPDSDQGLLDDEENWIKWKLEYCGIRTSRFAYDPVVSSAQSKAQYQAAKFQFQKKSMEVEGPTSEPTTKVFLGHKLLCRNPNSVSGSGVELFCVEKFADFLLPSSTNLVLKCSSYQHTPNPEVSGLWGSFVRLDFKQRAATWIRREHIVVYNCGDMVRTGKFNYLSLPALRALSRAAPAYACPPLVPPSHASGNSAKKNPKSNEAKKKPPARKRSVNTRCAESSSEDSDSSSESSSDDDGSPDDASEEVEDQVEDDNDPVAHQPFENVTDAPTSPGMQATGKQAQPAPTTDSLNVLPRGALSPIRELSEPLPSLAPYDIGFANMSDEAFYDQYKCQISPFMVSNSTTNRPDHIMVHYFQQLNPFTTPWNMVHKLTDGSYNRKTWTYNKYWKDVSFGEYKSAFNNKSKKTTIPDSYFLSNWPAEELDKKCILPIVAPAGLLKDPIRGEKIVFRMEFIMEQLLPLLRSRGLAKAKP